MISKHRWFSGRMLACHAGGPGSIPGRCKSFFNFAKIICYDRRDQKHLYGYELECNINIKTCSNCLQTFIILFVMGENKFWHLLMVQTQIALLHPWPSSLCTWFPFKLRRRKSSRKEIHLLVSTQNKIRLLHCSRVSRTSCGAE